MSTSRGRVFGAWADDRHLRARDYANSSKDGRVGVFKVKVVTKPLCWVIIAGNIMQLALFTGRLPLHKP